MDTLSVAEIRRLLAEAHGRALAARIRQHAADDRAGVRDAVAAAERRLARERAEDRRLRSLLTLERGLVDAGLAVVAGVDEVGRGALAGPVTAAACVIDVNVSIRGVADSKQLTPQARVELDHAIREHALAVAIAHVDAQVIDTLGIARATVQAMREALDGLPIRADHAIVDGLPVDIGCPSTAVVGGDSSCRSIAAASIVAKVARDALMRELDRTYPGYDLAVNKGYSTAAHLAAIQAIGPSPIHRRSFEPCSQTRLF